MKHKKLIIGLLFVALLVLVVKFGRPYSLPTPTPVSTGQSFDPEALAIRDKLYAKSKEYGAKTKRQTELQMEIDQLTAEKSILVEAAAGYDRVLCADYRLQYTRPSPESQSGALVKGCDFL